MPSDDTPSLDQMRLALLNQIPGQTIRTTPSEWDTADPGSVAGMNQPATQQRPLDAVKATFQDLANPFRIVQSMKDAATTLAIKPFVPPAAIISSAVQGLSAAPGIAYRQYLGDPQSMQEAAAIQGSLPTADQLNRQYSQALTPKTAAGQTFEEELGKGFDTAKVPHMWPISPRGGMVGNITGLEERRPMLSPNDVRVMGAQVAETGRNIAAIPADIRNAQQGITRLTPSGRAPIGETIFNAAEKGAAPFEGMLTPESDMSGMFPFQAGVIRPFGSTVSQPNVPPSARKDSAYLKFKGNEIDRAITTNLPEKGAPLTPHVALGQYDFAINANESPDLHKAYNKYINDTLKDLYPSLKHIERFEALRVLYPNQEDRAQVMLGMINGFLETPQAKELALRELGHEVPASDQLQQRHDAAVNWLTTRLNDYVSKYIGTAQDPGLSLAAKGMTVLTPNELRQSAEDSTYGVQNRRQTAGYPVEGAFAKPLEDKNAEIDKQTAVVNDLASRKAQEASNARDLGIQNAEHPPWVAASNLTAKAQNQLNKLNTQKGLLEQATNYESLADMAIRGGGVGTEVPPAQRQFWPGSQPVREYIADAAHLDSLGIPEIARKFYDDVMSGKLPVDSIQGLTAPKYIEKLGKAQLATTTNKARLAEEYRQDVTREALATIPPDAPVFGNTKVVELTVATPKADALKEASLATAVLDVCIGEGGRASDGKKHFLTGKDQTYESVLLPNGQPNPKASNRESPYINSVYDNGHTHSVFRDAETGFPVAVLQFQPSGADRNQGAPMYNIGFTSGWHNKNIDAKYVDDVRDYLNSRADNIKSISDHTEQHAGITDLNDRRSKHDLSSALGNDSRYLDKYDLSGLPRFVLPKDVKTYIEQIDAANPVAVSQAVALTDQRPSDSLPAYVASTMASAFDNVLENQRIAHDEAGEENSIGVSESYFTNLRDSLNELLRAHTPVGALTILIQNLDIEEHRLANSNRLSNNLIADGVIDLGHAVNSLLQDAIPRYMATRMSGAVAPAVATQPAVSQAVALADLPAYITSAMSAVFDELLEGQRAVHDDRGESNRIGVSESYFNDARNLFDAALREEGPRVALEILISNLNRDGNQLANSNRASDNIIAGGIMDLLHAANLLLQDAIPRNEPAVATQPAVAEQLDPATDGEIGSAHDAIGGAFVFPEASLAVQAALRRIGDTVADTAIPGSETVAQYLDNVDGSLLRQILNIADIVDRGDFAPGLLGFTFQSDVAMYQQGLDVARTMVQRLQTQLEEGDWVPEPGLLPELAAPMPEPRAVEPAAEIRMPALSHEDEDVANGILDILENPDYGFLPHDASATEYTLLANSFENDPADILGMGYPPYEEALENAAVVRYIAQFLRRRARAPEPRAVDQAIEPAVDLSDEDEGVAMSILDAFHHGEIELGLLSDNPTSTEFRSLAARFRQNPEDVLGTYAEMLEDAQDRAAVVRYVADFFRQRARDTGLPRGRAPRGYQKGGIVQQDPTTDQMRYELMMRRH